MTKTPFDFCEVTGVSLYQAPPVVRVRPYRVAKGVELVELLLEGTVFVEVGGRRQRFGRGALFWQRAGQWTLSETLPDSPYQCLSVQFKLKAPPPVQPPRVRVLDDPDLPRVIAEDLMRGFHREKVDRSLLSVEAYTRLARAAMSSPVAGRLPSTVRRAFEHIQLHLSGDLRLEALASSLGISESKLRMLFKQHAGTTPHQYILEQRLRESRVRLATGRPVVKVVAAACGFSSPEVFCRCFRARFGITPGAYRDQFRR